MNKYKLKQSRKNNKKQNLQLLWLKSKKLNRKIQIKICFPIFFVSIQAFHLRHILESLPRFANSFTVFTLIPSYEQATLYPSDLDLNAMLTMDTLSTISMICGVSSINNDRESLLSALQNVSNNHNDWSIAISLTFSV